MIEYRWIGVDDGRPVTAKQMELLGKFGYDGSGFTSVEASKFLMPLVDRFGTEINHDWSDRPKPTAKQLALLKRLGVEEAPADIREATRLLHSLLGTKQSKGARPTARSGAMPPQTQRLLALKLSCPKCGASSGEACWARKRPAKRKAFHKERFHACREKLEKALLRSGLRERVEEGLGANKALNELSLPRMGIGRFVLRESVRCHPNVLSSASPVGDLSRRGLPEGSLRLGLLVVGVPASPAARASHNARVPTHRRKSAPWRAGGSPTCCAAHGFLARSSRSGLLNRRDVRYRPHRSVDSRSL